MVFSYWREFGARYVTALCTRPDGETRSTITHNPSPPDAELAWLALAAPPMTGAEYLTASVLQSLWQELDIAFGLELSESKCCEKQVNARVIPTSAAIAESVELTHEFSNRVLRRVGREFPRVGMSASGHRSRCYSAGS
jgi:hypothetical protein